MRVVCDNCGAKYQVADEKVRNKVVKFRCKRCSEMVLVRPPDMGHEDEDLTRNAGELESGFEPTQQLDYGDAQRAMEADENAIWHVVVNREQIGPMTVEDVAGHFGRGEITGESFAWKDGMSDWTSAASIPELAHIFVDVAHDRAPESGSPFSSAAMGDFEQDEDDVIASNNVDDPFGAVNEQAFDDDADGGSLANQRNENSVLFSMESLEAQQSSRGQVSNTGGSEGSGLIDLSIFGGGGSADENAPFAGPGGIGGGVASGIGNRGSLVMRGGGSSSRLGIWVGSAIFGGLALIGAVLYFALKQPTPPQNPVAQKGPAVAQSPTKPSAAAVPAMQKSPPQAAPAQAPAAPAAPASAAAVAATTAQTGDKATPTSASRSAAQAPKPASSAKKKSKSGSKARSAKRSKRKSTQRKAERRPKSTSSAQVAAAPPPPKRKPTPQQGKKDEVDELLGALDGGSSKPARSPRSTTNRTPARRPAPSQAPSDPLLPEKLNKRQISQVVKKNARSLVTCRNRSGYQEGIIMVNFTIGQSGRVTSAKVKTTKFKQTPLAQCVEGKVNSFRFPQFSGPPMQINYPFRI